MTESSQANRNRGAVRKLLSSDERSRRRLVLIEQSKPAPRVLPDPAFENGNSKVGFSSRHYEQVLVWNIPPISTCPGSTPWCESACYNGQDRPQVYRFDQWRANLLAFNEDPEGLKSLLLTALPADATAAVRIHSAGDFFSTQYIDLWDEIVRSRPSVDFWCYTRSWDVPTLLPRLELFRTAPNVQVFASWDRDMGTPPAGWRVSYVSEDGSSPLGGSDTIRCPEETGDTPDCATCRYCLRDSARGVWFTAH